MDPVVGIDRGIGTDHGGIGPRDAHVVEQIGLPGAAGSAVGDELATVEDEVVEVVEGRSILDLSAIVDREDGRREVGGIAEHVGGVEVEGAAAIHRDGGASGSHAVLGIAKDESARIHEGRSGEGVGPREGEGRVAVLGEGTRSRDHATQGLVRRVAEDERAVVGDVRRIGAVAQKTRHDEGAIRGDRGGAGVGIRFGQDRRARSAEGDRSSRVTS